MRDSPFSVFQFHVGAITRGKTDDEYFPVLVVSIPRWCNYKKPAAIAEGVPAPPFQFHVGAITS